MTYYIVIFVTASKLNHNVLPRFKHLSTESFFWVLKWRCRYGTHHFYLGVLPRHSTPLSVRTCRIYAGTEAKVPVPPPVGGFRRMFSPIRGYGVLNMGPVQPGPEFLPLKQPLIGHRTYNYQLIVYRIKNC